MEYVFLFVFLAMVGFYLSDAKGWNATAKRLTTIVRAHLESSKPVKAIEPVQERDAWEQQFKAIENPESVLAPAPPSNHEIIKTDYYRTEAYGLWPRWHCKCGVNSYEPRGGRTMEVTQRAAKKSADQHVIDGAKEDALMAKTNGKFAW